MASSPRKHSLATVISTATLLPLLVVGVALTLISLRSGRTLSTELGGAMVEQTVERVGGSVDRYLSTVTRLSEVLGSAVEQGAIRPENMDAWRSRINVCLDTTPGLSAIGYVDVPSGQYLYIVRYGNTRELGEVNGTVGPGQIATSLLDGHRRPIESTRRVEPYELEKRPWYRQAIVAAQPTWSQTYEWYVGASQVTMRRDQPSVRGIAHTRLIRQPTTGQPATIAPTSRPADGSPRAFAAPADASIRGVLSIDLSLDRINAYLAETARPLDASLVMTDASGQVVAASDPRVLQAWPRPGTPTVDDATFETLGPVEQAIARRIVQMGANAFAHRDATSALQRFAVEGRTYSATQRSLTVSPQISWNLIVAIPDQPVILQAQAAIRGSIWIGIGYVTLAAVTSIAIARLITRPIRRLARFARRIGKGDFEQRITPGKTREVAELGCALNDMAAGLQERVALLSAKEAAESAGAAKARLIAHVSHEFRTPLNAIVGYAGLIQDAARAQGRGREAEDAGNILIASRHLLGMFENLLDLSRADAGRLTVSYAAFAVRDLIDDVVRTVRPVLERNGNRVVIDAPPAELRMASDAGRLTQILTNLLGNAGKFTRDGEIRLAAAAATTADGKQWIDFEVYDTGIGIAADQLRHVFEPFVQVHRSTGGSGCVPMEGAGLGLAISRQLSELLGGTIELQSELGRGTTVRVRIPQHPSGL